MRWMWIGAVLFAAACGPRAMMSSRTATGSGSGSDTGSDTGSGSGSGSDTDTGTATASVDQRGSLVWSRLPAPHLAPAAPLPSVTTVDAARRLAGRRDRRAPLAIALELSSALAASAPLPTRTEVDLIAYAQEHNLWTSVPAIAAGDLLVFDRAVAGAPASLIAVALGRDARGVIEMLYVARGVLRRGFVDPSRPRVVRDRERRAVNTYLRHGADQPPSGTRYLAGELFAGVIAASAR